MSNDDDGWDGRDLRGRWCKGHCPNPRGRPRKKATVSDADVMWFKNAVQEVSINGVKRLLTRHELLHHSMFDHAVKGKSVNIAKKLLELFEQADMERASAHFALRDMNAAIEAGFKRTGKYDDKLLADAAELMKTFNHGAERAPERKSRVRKKAKANAPTWRSEPKSDWLLEQEELWAEQEAAKVMARARHTLKNPQDAKKQSGLSGPARFTKKTKKD